MLGIEMLDEYTTDAFDTGRGVKVQANAVAAIAILSAVLGLDSVTMRLHKENPLHPQRLPGQAHGKGQDYQPSAVLAMRAPRGRAHFFTGGVMPVLPALPERNARMHLLANYQRQGPQLEKQAAGPPIERLGH